MKAPLLTYNGENNHHKIKNIPSDGEIVITKRDQFQHTFSSEQNNKHQINPVQNVGHFLTLVISLHHHGDHVEADEDHDRDVERLLCHQVVHQALDLVLQQGWECGEAGGWVSGAVVRAGRGQAGGVRGHDTRVWGAGRERERERRH